jgi:uncharacterized protein YndB with AHSA1/START domain
MAIGVTIDTTIARPPDVVFDRIADVMAWPTWLIASGIVSVARAVDGPLVPGERLTVQQRAAGRFGRFETVVREVDRPTRLAVEGRDADGVSIDIDATLAPIEGGSSLRWSIRIGLPFRYRIFESMARPEVERAAALDIEGLRRSLDAPSG